MKTLSRILLASFFISSINAIAWPPLRPLSNEEANALLSAPSAPSAPKNNSISRCADILRTPQGITKRSSEQIRCTIDQHGESLNDIYQRALRNSPYIEGSIVFSLLIEPTGIVSSAEAIESTIADEVFIKELRSELMAIKFPDEKVEKYSGTHTFNFMSGY